MERKRWLTTGEAAELLGFTDRWVRKQIDLGTLKAVAFDSGSRRTIRVSSTELRAFRARYFRDARRLPPRSGG